MPRGVLNRTYAMPATSFLSNVDMNTYTVEFYAYGFDSALRVIDVQAFTADDASDIVRLFFPLARVVCITVPGLVLV